MATFEDFNREFFKNTEVASRIKWFGKKGILTIDEKRNAEIELCDYNYGGHYSGYVVKIVHKENGKISSQSFRFNDYLKGREDDRGHEQRGFEIISHCGINWYIAIPKNEEVDAMANKILEYVVVYS